MSSFLVPFKSTWLIARLATSAAGQKTLARLASSTSHSFHSRIPIPVRSQHVVPSLSIVAIPAQSSTPSQFVRTKPASSLPKKTADSIQKHMKRVSFALMRFGVPVQLRSSSLTRLRPCSFVRLVPPPWLTRLPQLPSRQCLLLPDLDQFQFQFLDQFHRLVLL